MPSLHPQVQELRADKADIRVDFMFADVMKQGGWVEEATLLYINTNLSAVNMRELRKRAGCMQVRIVASPFPTLAASHTGSPRS